MSLYCLCYWCRCSSIPVSTVLKSLAVTVHTMPFQVLRNASVSVHSRISFLFGMLLWSLSPSCVWHGLGQWPPTSYFRQRKWWATRYCLVGGHCARPCQTHEGDKDQRSIPNRKEILEWTETEALRRTWNAIVWTVTETWERCSLGYFCTCISNTNNTMTHNHLHHFTSSCVTSCTAFVLYVCLCFMKVFTWASACKIL